MIFKKQKDENKEKASSKKKLFKKKRSLIIVIIALVAVIGVGGFFAYRHFFGTKKVQNTTTEAKVTRGSIVNVIEGSGTIEAKAQYEVKYLSSVDVVADYFEEGDYVTKGQVLYKMDSEDIERNIAKQRRNVEKAQMNYEDALSGKSDYNVKTEISGVITNMYVSKGDNVSNGTKIADIIDKDTLLLSIPFGKDDSKNIYYGQNAEVTLQSSSMPVSGTVTNVGSGAYINSYGVEVADVEITIKNPGAVSEGTLATAMIGEYACYDSGTIEYANTKTIVSKASGEVMTVNRKKGDAVSAGTVLVSLDDSKTERSIKEAKLSLEDANSSLEQLYETKNDATIKSEISGKVIQKNIKAGEILDSNTSSTMAIIADLSALKFNMSIDELDISKIKVGQEVSVTADALSGQNFKGTVTNVSIVGSSYQGVTSYPVTVTIDNTAETQLIPGMNVEAQIVIDSVNNALRLPVSALRMGSYVIVKDDGTFKDPLEIPSFPGFEGRKTPADKKDASDAKSEAKSAGANDMNGERPQMDGGKAPMNGERPRMDGSKAPMNGESPRMDGSKAPMNGERPQMDGAKYPANGEKAQEKETKQTAPSADGSNAYAGRMPGGADAEEMQKKMKERIKSMIDSLDVPEGYTVVRVQTGLNDGDFVEIKEIEGSLKEGDTVLIPVVISNAQQSMNGAPFGGMGGMGGMPRTGGMGGMGGMPRTGGMGGMGGMPRTGGMSGMSRTGSTGGANRGGFGQGGMR